ncbi:hypothetical protein [Methylobacterium radiotolerans]
MIKTILSGCLIACSISCVLIGPSVAKDAKLVDLLALSFACHSKVQINNNPGAIQGYQNFYSFKDAGDSFTITQEETEIFSSKELPVFKLIRAIKARYSDIGKVSQDKSTLIIACKKSRYCFDERLLSNCKNSVCEKPGPVEEGDDENGNRKRNIESFALCDREAVSNAKLAIESLKN